MAAEVRFSVLRKKLEAHGWTLARTRGSHHTLTKPGRRAVPIPVHRQKDDAVYARLVDKICSENKGD